MNKQYWPAGREGKERDLNEGNGEGKRRGSRRGERGGLR